jgi:hypothetical protein
MNESRLLIIDGVINLALGVLLVAFPAPLIQVLGLPSESRFYANILGAVLIGIAIALFIQHKNGSGLGLDGAVVINLCGGATLAAWLVFGDLDLNTGGAILLWALVILLVGLSFTELLARHWFEKNIDE